MTSKFAALQIEDFSSDVDVMMSSLQSTCSTSIQIYTQLGERLPKIFACLIDELVTMHCLASILSNLPHPFLNAVILSEVSSSSIACHVLTRLPLRFARSADWTLCNHSPKTRAERNRAQPHPLITCPGPYEVRRTHSVWCNRAHAQLSTMS